jgi:hypothetical protein
MHPPARLREPGRGRRARAETLRGLLWVKMSRATHFIGMADLPQSKRTRWAGGRRFRIGPGAEIQVDVVCTKFGPC